MSEFTGFDLKGEVPPEPKADKITLRNALKMPYWMKVCDTEPGRLIDVRMSYADLQFICDTIDELDVEAREQDEKINKYEVLKATIKTTYSNSLNNLEAVELRMQDINCKHLLWTFEYGRKQELMQWIEKLEQWIYSMDKMEAEET